MNHNIKDTALQPVHEKLQPHLLTNRNIRFARKRWEVSRDQVAMLRDLTAELHLSLAAGHVKLIDGNWYVTHAGFCDRTTQSLLRAFTVLPVSEFSDPASGRWVFKATVYKSPHSRGFVGYGDADPSNVSSTGPRRRDARRRNPRRQSRPPQGLRHRPLLGRGTRLGTQIQRARSARSAQAPPRTETMATTTASLASATASAC